ncbi:alpha-glucan water dikinase, chloroplastic-like isoform X1 [Camellia sinensis]|uniref:alpha-glucan water dikinase, chloroplastic-like isoform X1 n=1 Tax=Camellia sinensis TaxID=4442 RepID=UPI0010369493|nr:alpha-glucan water dikinase, chloroplastic-like isoform X1 [Camellia sinensis]
MSNSIGHNLIHHNLLALVVLEHQSKINSSCISSYNLFQVQANSQIRKPHITSKFWGKCLNLWKTKLPMGTNRVLSVFPQSVLATDPTSKVVVSAPTSGSVSEIDMQITNTSGTLVLHWGGIQNGKDLWIMSLHSSETAQNKKLIANGLKIL